MTIGERIRELRTENGMTTIDLANALGVTQSAITHWEVESNLPSTTNLQKLSDLFSVRYEWLNLGEGEKTEKAAEEAAHKEAVKDKVFYTMQDEIDLHNINVCIRYIKEMNISKDTKKSVYRTLVKYRNALEETVMFGREER